MHDRNINARHKVMRAIENDWRDEKGGRWRLTQHDLADYAEPWKPLSEDDIRSEYESMKGNPFAHYVKHLSSRHDGEVALAWEKWQPSDEDLPRDSMLWRPQYAVSDESFHALSSLKRGDELYIEKTEDLLAVGSTTILRPLANSRGHRYLRGGAITLCELFAQFGEKFTVYELMFWYHNARKFVQKRPHAWGSQLVRDAINERKKCWGHYGHWDESSAGAAQPWEHADKKNMRRQQQSPPSWWISGEEEHASAATALPP